MVIDLGHDMPAHACARRSLCHGCRRCRRAVRGEPADPACLGRVSRSCSLRLWRRSARERAQASRRLLALALSWWLATVALLASHSRARQKEDLETFIPTNQRLRVVGPGDRGGGRTNAANWFGLGYTASDGCYMMDKSGNLPRRAFADRCE